MQEKIYTISFRDWFVAGAGWWMGGGGGFGRHETRLYEEGEGQTFRVSVKYEVRHRERELEGWGRSR